MKIIKQQSVMAKNVQYHGRAKQEREHVASTAVKLEYCSTEEMIADIFTEGLSAVQFTKLRKMLGVSYKEHTVIRVRRSVESIHS